MGNYRGRKQTFHKLHGEQYNFRGEKFCRLLTFAAPKNATPPNFAQKTFTNSYKTVKFTKVFSLKRFPAIRYPPTDVSKFGGHILIFIFSMMLYDFFNDVV